MEWYVGKGVGYLGSASKGSGGVGKQVASNIIFYRFRFLVILFKPSKPSVKSVALDIRPKHLTLVLTQPNFHHIERFLGKELRQQRYSSGQIR